MLGHALPSLPTLPLCRLTSTFTGTRGPAITGRAVPLPATGGVTRGRGCRPPLVVVLLGGRVNSYLLLVAAREEVQNQPAVK